MKLIPFLQSIFPKILKFFLSIYVPATGSFTFFTSILLLLYMFLLVLLLWRSLRVIGITIKLSSHFLLTIFNKHISVIPHRSTVSLKHAVPHTLRTKHTLSFSLLLHTLIFTYHPLFLIFLVFHIILERITLLG